ncbi:MAG: hypothetical protein AAGE94_17895 [Acidobacteriota bacterium]
MHFSLEHAHRFVSREAPHQSLWDPPLFYPERNVGAYTDTMLGWTPFYSPWRWLGASPLGAYQLWMPTVLALTFVVAFSAMRRLFAASPIAATAGAYVFAFAGPRIASFGHPQMVPWLYWALACFAIGRLVLDPPADTAWDDSTRGRWLAVLVLALVAQAYGAFYPFFFFGFLAILWGLVALASPAARRRLRSLWIDEGPAWTLAAACGALLLAPLAQRYLLTAEILGTRPIEHVHNLMPRLGSWWTPPPNSHLYGSLWRSSMVQNAPEWFGTRAFAHGLGVLTTLLAIFGLWAQRRRLMVRLLVATAVVLIVLTTRWPGGATLWNLVYETLPGASAVRAVSRFGHCLILPAALGVMWWLDRPAMRRRPWLAWAVVVLIGIEQSQKIQTWTIAPAAARVEAIAATIDPSCEAFYLGWQAPVRFFDEDAMWVAMATGVPTINGRYGNTPRRWVPLRRQERHPRVGPAESDLRTWLAHHCVDPRGICVVDHRPDGTYHAQRLGSHEEGHLGCGG